MRMHTVPEIARRPAPESLEEALDQICAHADGARIAAAQVLQWQVDHVKADLGMVEVLEEWPPGLLPPDCRMLLCHRSCAPYGHFHVVRDVR